MEIKAFWYKYKFTLGEYAYYTLTENERRYFKRLHDVGDYIEINSKEYSDAYWQNQKIRINNGL